MKAVQKLSIWICVAFIRLYQWTLSPFVGRHCRFQPTCSRYAEEAIRRHGTLRGCWLAAKRLSKCHPWGGAGWDPVPDQAPQDQGKPS